jgi:hypothetical protein
MDAVEDLPPDARATVLRLLSFAAANRMNLPNEMLAEIQSISVEGADPEWQVQQMKQILDRWARTRSRFLP